MKKMYYLIKTNDKKEVLAYIHKIYSVGNKDEYVNDFQRAMILTELDVLKHYIKILQQGYSICEIELDNRVELKYEFISVNSEEITNTDIKKKKNENKTTVKD